MRDKKIAVLISCYNESLTIEKVIKDFQAALPDADIYVYDKSQCRQIKYPQSCPSQSPWVRRRSSLTR